MHQAAKGYERRWRERLGPAGETIGRWQVMSVLSAVDGARIGLIASTVGMTQPVLSRVVDQLEREGLVERRPIRGDLRGVGAWLTRRGRQRFEQLVPAAAELVDESLAGFSPAEVRTLHRLLTRLVATLEAGDDIDG
jgi:DNA-binding MarR family transcriptional regulator